MRRLILAAILLSLGLAPAAEPPIYKDPSTPVADRVEDLLGRMTLEEKVAQMTAIWEDKNLLLDEEGIFDPTKAEAVLGLGIGQVTRPADTFGRGESGVTPQRSIRSTVEFVNAVQRYLRDETRLGIPALMHEEGLHGYQARDTTVFPQAIALASTWDPALVEEVYSVVAREISVRGARQALTPVIDVARDPRWGRIEETYGEDPYLVGEMGLAAVRGFQGRSMPLAEGKVFATLKHMTGHGEPESGTNVGPANISERVLREFFLPPFERAVKEGGALNVMASYNEIDGIPSHASTWLLRDVLRGEWNFEGVVVADYYAITQLMDLHHAADSLASAATQAVTAGVDIELPNPNAYPHLIELVRAGILDEATLDDSVRRLLRLKFLAGLFEHPFADADQAERLTGASESRPLALRAAEAAITLLDNDHGLLPLDPTTKQRIAVIGPNADEAILGGYTDVPRQTVSLLEGIESRLGSDADVVFAPGVRLTTTRNWWADEVTLVDPEENRRSITQAVEVAKGADVVILAIGDNEQTSREAWAANHLGDRDSLQLVGEQNALVKAILDTGVPTIVVLFHGRPLAVTEVAERATAIVDGWYLGQETGTAMARVLFGDVNPGGKLPLTIPRSVGQIPSFYNHKPSARRGYLFETTEPLWPFGYGLSYTQFEFAAPRVTGAQIQPDGATTLEVDVTNTGDRAGDEVVQFYVHDVNSTVTRPVKELKGFERINLQPGERKTVSFEVGPEVLRAYDRSMQRVVEPGVFELMVGPNSRDLQIVELNVTLDRDDAADPDAN
jgi:beta-glucosidase